MAGNARSGRRAQPEALRNLRGSRHRPWHADEAKHDRTMPECPAFVAEDELALETWDTLGRRLFRVGVLHAGHGELLAALCTTWADYTRARREFAETGRKQVVRETYMTPAGETAKRVKVNPLVTRIDRLTRDLRVLLGEFGLTPMTAAKVKAGDTPKDEGDPFAALMSAENPYAAKVPN